VEVKDAPWVLFLFVFEHLLSLPLPSLLSFTLAFARLHPHCKRAAATKAKGEAREVKIRTIVRTQPLTLSKGKS
jgi:hypothetical protein